MDADKVLQNLKKSMGSEYVSTLGKDVSRYIQSAYLAANFDLLRTYLRQLARTPWIATAPQWKAPEHNSATSARAKHLIEQRVDFAIKQLELARHKGLSMHNAANAAISSVVRLPLYDPMANRYAIDRDEYNPPSLPEVIRKREREDTTHHPYNPKRSFMDDSSEHSD